jgi:hypothetical protein
VSPRCESCRAEPVEALSYFEDVGWWLTGRCGIESEEYYIPIDDVLGPGDRRRWREHLEEKSWFDAADFVAALARLDAAASRTST